MDIYQEVQKLDFGKCIGMDALTDPAILVHIGSLNYDIVDAITDVFGHIDVNNSVLSICSSYMLILFLKW